jgi:D-sedoheptulose 7-phosphate isomerase
MIDINAIFSDHLDAITRLKELVPTIEDVAHQAVKGLENGGKIIWMGNGGSAADSQHMAAELVGRYQRNRRGLASIALTTDTSLLTAVANDLGFDTIFERQIEALCRPEDTVIGISTSGNSLNVLRAIKKARSIGAFTVGLTGRDGGKMVGATDSLIIVPADDTARIQEAHILIGHILCDWIEEAVT